MGQLLYVWTWCFYKRVIGKREKLVTWNTFRFVLNCKIINFCNHGWTSLRWYDNQVHQLKQCQFEMPGTILHRQAKRFATNRFRCCISCLWDRVCSSYSGAGKFCLAHELRQLTHNVKHDVRTLNFRSDVTFAPKWKTPNDIQKRLLCNVKCQKYKKWQRMDNDF